MRKLMGINKDNDSKTADQIDVTMLHKEAEQLEKQGMTQGKLGNTHAMHEKMDIARCFRICANYIEGNKAG